MAHILTIGVPLSRGSAGLAASLAAQLVDTAGANVGDSVTSGFVELGLGHYEWTYAAMPDGFRGAVKFSVSGAHRATAWINPQEHENADVKTSTASAADSTVSVTVSQVAAAVAAAAASSGTLVARRGDTYSQQLTGIGGISGNTKLWFTVKTAGGDADAAAIIQIERTVGLLYLNGAVAAAGDGSVTVNDATLGTITIALSATATAQLVPGTRYSYDVQILTGTTVRTVAEGSFHVLEDRTRATS